ncbi:DUF551 domain-containing protein [Enterobacter hormaechei]|uniref:DUF551 domain-containing protein n=1 Tax=Enterobacter hormaechei TaxID=158836 RepID=UPI003C2CA087
MITLTKEWLLKTIAELEEERDATPGAVNEDAANALAAMKLALASLEAKDKIPELRQVIYHFRDWNEGFPIERFKADYVISWMLANYPPAQPAAVSDSLLSELLAIAKKAADAADECAHAEWSDDSMEHSTAIADWERRATMLHGAEPVSNLDELPEGWVACSERMPEDEQEVITHNIFGYRHVSFFDEHSGHFFDRLDGSPVDCVEHVLVSHWMPLPAAPQQEVK